VSLNLIFKTPKVVFNLRKNEERGEKNKMLKIFSQLEDLIGGKIK
jgi:hypothetical protein